MADTLLGEQSPFDKAPTTSGWVVYYLGRIRLFAFEQVVPNLAVSSGQRSNAGSISPPPGHVDFSRLRVFTGWYGNYAGHAVPGIDAGGFTTIANQYSGGSLSFSGSLHVFALEK